MAALKHSLAQDTPAIWAGRPSKSEPGPQQIGASAHCFTDSRRPKKKEEAATEPALAATSRKRPERCQTTLLRNGSRWVLLSTRRLWRRTMHYGVALGPACTIA